MTHTTITCDICNYTFAGQHWEDSPAKWSVHFGHPRQQYESYEKEHVCRDCVKAIQAAISEAVAARSGAVAPAQDSPNADISDGRARKGES